MSDVVRTGAGVATGLHEVVWVRGPDTIRFLDGLISQDVASMTPGAVAHSFLLAPNGKLRAPHVLWRGTEDVAIVVSTGLGEIVVGDLNKFRIRVDATIGIDDRIVIDLAGPTAQEVLTSAGYVSLDPLSWTDGEVVVGAVPFVSSDLPRFVFIGASIEALTQAGAVEVSVEEFDRIRVEAGEPIVGRDVGASTIPQEMGSVDHAVSFTKGCFLGQELVARIDSRGRVNRRLLGLVFAPGANPQVGARVHAADKLVGELTSVVESTTLGAPVALALVRREVQVGDDVAVVWDEGEGVAVVRSLPLV